MNSLERRVLTAGFEVLAAITAWFATWKWLLMHGPIVHAEKASVHRLFFGLWRVRFPQEAFSLADLLTALFLFAAGGFALQIALCSSRGTSRFSASRFFALLGVGLVWLGLDEIFLLHEFASANLRVNDNWILLVYAVLAGLTCVAFRSVLFSVRPAFAILMAGAAVHAGALGMDFLQDRFGWLPEEPSEMIAAGLYAIAMAGYAARLLSWNDEILPRVMREGVAMTRDAS